MSTPVSVLVTRPRERAAALYQCIEARGWQCLRLPVLALRALPAAAPPPALTDFQLVVFVSPAAVEHGLARLGPWPPGQAALAVGAATAQALRGQGIDAQVPASGNDSEAMLASAVVSDLRAGQRVLLVRGRGGRDLLAGTLRGRGVQVQVLEVYERLRQAAPATVVAALAVALDEAAAGARHCFVLITSADGLASLRDMLDERLWQALLRHGRPVGYSPRLAALLAEAGFRRPALVVATEAAALVAAIDAELGC